MKPLKYERMDQIEYYNQWAEINKQDILNCEDPSIWTTDMAEQGPNFVGIRTRVQVQIKIILERFDNTQPVLDLGCGFGRQAYLVAKQGFPLTGIDSSEALIGVARDIFSKHGLRGTFIHGSINEFKPVEKFSQIILLDVYEHIEPRQRPLILRHIFTHICAENGRMVVSFPAMNSYPLMHRLRLWIYNIRTPARTREHPFPIPSKKRFENDIKDLFKIEHYQQTQGTHYWVLKKN